MKSLDEMPVNDAIRLYYEKQHAIRQSDMSALVELKNECPDLFDSKNEAQICNIIEYAKITMRLYM